MIYRVNLIIGLDAQCVCGDGVGMVKNVSMINMFI